MTFIFKDPDFWIGEIATILFLCIIWTRLPKLNVFGAIVAVALIITFQTLWTFKIYPCAKNLLGSDKP